MDNVLENKNSKSNKAGGATNSRIPSKGLGKGLGRGLNALIPSMDTEYEENNSGLATIKIEDIISNKHQPRKFFNDEKIAELAQSISEHGVVQPIVVKKEKEGKYLIVAGERRWRASKLAGLKELPVIIKDYSEKTVMEVALIENLQREDLNPVEEAMAYKSLVDEFELTQEEVAKKLGKSRSAIANTLRLLNLPEQVREMLVTGKITAGHGRAILSLETVDEQIAAAERAANFGLNVREAENLKKKPLDLKSKEKRFVSPEIITIQESLMERIGSQVKLHYKKGKGKIELSFNDDDELNRILDFIHSKK